jgi:hypothetical protein
VATSSLHELAACFCYVARMKIAKLPSGCQCHECVRHSAAQGETSASIRQTGRVHVQYESILFFLLATIGAASVMVSFVGLVAGAAGGVTYGLIRVTGQTRRIATAPDGRRRLRGQPVPGYAQVNLAGEHYYRPTRGEGAGVRHRRPGDEFEHGGS